MFCPNCGNKLAEAAAQAVEEVAAPVQETVTQAVEQVAAPVQETVAQTVEQVAAPVQETVAQAVEQVAAPVQETVTQAVGTTIPPLPEMPQINGIQQPTEPVQPEFNVRPASQPVPEQPVQQFPGAASVPEAPVTPVKKKKGKGGVIAGVTAAAVVVGGAGVGYFGFHDKITRTFMGDVAYAQMVNKDAVSSITKADAFDSGTELGVGAFMDSVISSKVYSLTGDSSAVTSSYLSILKTMGTGAGSNYENIIEEALSAIPEGTKVTSKNSVKIEAGSVFALVSDGQIGDILNKINDFSFVSELVNGSTDMISFGLSDSDGNIGSLEAYMDESGDIVLAFPGISEKTVRIKKEDIEKSLNGSEEKKEETPSVTFSEDEAKRIRQAVTDIYYDTYNSARISYSDAVFTMGDGEWKTEAKGTSVSVSFTPAELKAMIDKIGEFLKNDAYLISYAKDRFDLSEEDYKGIFKEAEDVKYSLVSEQLVDVHNKVIGSKYIIEQEDSANKIIAVNISGDKLNAGAIDITGKDGKKVGFKLFDRSENGKDGSMLAQLGIEQEDVEFAFKVDYTGKDKAQWLGKETGVGTYIVTLADPDKFVDSMKKLSDGGTKIPDISDFNANMSNELIAPVMSVAEGGNDKRFGIDNEKLIAEIKKLEIVMSTVVDGNTMNTDLSISAGDIGKITFTSASVSESANVSLPDSSKEISSDDKEAQNEFTEEALGWVGGLTEKLGLGDLGSMLGGMGSIGSSGFGGDNDEDSDKKAHYAAYDRYESGTFADECAEKIYNGLNDTVKSAMTAKGSDVTSGVIKLWYDDGNLKVISDAGVSGITYTDSSFDSVYAEVVFDDRVAEGIAGVTVILTDNENDLPNNDYPAALNYYDQMYKWDNYGNQIGDFAAGSYPVLYYGDPYTEKLPDKKISVSELNEAARAVSESFSSYLGVSNRLNIQPMGEESVIQFLVKEDGAIVLYDEYTVIDEEKGKEAAEVVAKACDIKNALVGLYFCDNVFVGTAVLPDEGDVDTFLTMNSMPTANDFKSGEFVGWYGTSESDYESLPGYIYNNDYDAVRVGTYSLKTQGELVLPGENGSTSSSSAGAVGRWTVTDGYGDFFVADTDPSLVDMYVTVFEEDMALELGVTEGSFIGRYFVVPDGDSGDYMLFATKDDAEEADEDKVVGGLFFNDEDHSVLVIFDENQRYAMYELVREGAASAGGTGDYEFGEVKEDPELSDIAGEWVGELQSGTMVLHISTNGIISGSDSDDTYLFVNPRSGGFDIFSDIEGNVNSGSILYSAETDSISVTDGETVIFSRVSTQPAYGYIGEWELDTLDGVSMADIAERLDQPLEAINSYMTVSAYDIILTNSESTQILLIGAYDEGYYVKNPGENFVEVGDYDAATDTLQVTSSVFGEGDSQDAESTTILVFKRKN